MSTLVDPRARRWVAAAAVAAGLACLTIVVVPVAESHGVAAPWLRIAFAPACHQIADRCLDLGAGPMPVCARCFGLYFGGFVGLLAAAIARRRWQPRWTWVAAAAAPSVVDFLFGKLDWPTLTNWPRCVAAVIPAFLLGLLLADAIASIGGRRRVNPPAGRSRRIRCNPRRRA